MLYGGVKEAPNVSVEYQAVDQIPSFYVALVGIVHTAMELLAMELNCA